MILNVREQYFDASSRASAQALMGRHHYERGGPFYHHSRGGLHALLFTRSRRG
jgi:hypothetical protein